MYNWPMVNGQYHGKGNRKKSYLFSGPTTKALTLIVLGGGG